MKGLLISAYDADSHRSWHRSLTRELDQFSWTVLTLPPRHFAWRMRGNSLSLAFDQAEALQQPYDLMIATSMTDLAALRGLVPALAGTPAVLYFHENQFAYPPGHDDRNRLQIQLTSILSALAADLCVFNSDWNRRSFMAGACRLLDQMPDQVPADIGQKLAQSSAVIPVGLEAELFDRVRQTEADESVSLLWNHRWEYDKGPDRLLLALRQLKQRGLSFRLNLLGQQFRNQPAEFNRILSEFEQSVAHAGFIVDRNDYMAIVAESDLVLSTSVHDFQGLSILESAAAGVRPVVPDRLAYPEWFSGDCRYRSSDDAEQDAAHLADHIEKWVQQGRPVFDRNSIRQLAWPAIADQWRELLTGFCSSN